MEIGKRTLKSKQANVRLTSAIGAVIELMEERVMMAAHIVGSATVYPTIQSAVNAAAPGSTITVDAGTYDETVDVGESLTIEGANAGVDARGTRGAESIVYATQTVFYITANDVTIDGFTIEGDDANIGAAQGAGVLMAPSIHGTHVINNIIQDNVTGIYLSNNSNTDECLIQHNLIQNNFETGNNWATEEWNGSRGIYTDGTVSGGYLTNVLIDSNTIENSDFSAGDEDEGIIALQALDAGKQFNITITNNYLSKESKALLATNVTNLVFMGNTVTGFDDASSGPVRFEGDANVVDIQYNSIYGNSGPGVAADSSGVAGDSSGFVIDNNNIYSNDGIGVLTIASVYDGSVTAVGDWWGSASGPGGDGPGTGQAVWANGNSGHGVTPTGAAGGSITFSPWATSLINITSIPAPAAPAGLAATPASSSSINLAWTPQMSTAMDQLIQRSTDGVNFTTVATVPPLLNAFTDTGLSSGQVYYYRVVAANDTGNSAPSNAVSATPPAYAPPVAPTNLTVAGATSNTVALTWTAPSSTFGIVGYAVYRNGAQIATATTASFLDTTVAASTAYTYSVATLDNTGALSAQTSAVTAATPAAGTGLYGTYYSGTSFNTVVLSRVDPTVNFTWNGAVPATGVPTTNFSVKWVGQVTVPTTENYTFTTTSDDGVRLWIDGQELINDWTGHATTTDQGSISLLAGHTYSIELDYFQASGNDQINLFWQTPTIAQEIIPQTNLYPTLAPPSNLAATVSGNSVNLSWQDNASPTTSGFTIQRSTDGVNFTTIGATAAGITTYTDTTIAAGTTYTYRVMASGGGLTSAPSAPALASSAETITDLSSLNWISATTGWGTVNKNESVGGNPLKIRGVTYATGIGTHAVSNIVYNLGGAYTTFMATVGIDDEEVGVGTGSVDFQVIGDGKVLFDSGILTNASAAVNISVSVAGVQTLTLVATNGVAGSIDYDHADWAGAVLTSLPAAPVAPTNLVAVATNSTTVNLTWAEASANVSSFIIQRSTDGVNFTTLSSTVAGSATSYTDSTAAGGTLYYYRVLAVNSVGTSPASSAVSLTTPSASAITTYLSTLNWVSATAGWGTVEKNLSVGGNPITLNGVTYASGIGTHAVSDIVYNLGGNYTNFLSDIGIDGEEKNNGGSVDFQVIGDGTVLYDSGILTNTSPTVSIDVNVTGVQTLTLQATNGIAGSIDYDHADWAGARLLSSASQPPAAPSGLVAVTSSTTQVNLSWTNNAATATGFVIERSTSGGAFAEIGTTTGATTYFDTTAAVGTTYSYEVLATNAGGISSAASASASATTLAASAVVTNLSTLAWTSATAGWGSVQLNSTVAGNTITLRGVTYATGIGTHAVSTIVYNLAGNYTNFISDVGVDDEENGRGIGSVDFQVIGDGKVLFDSGVLTNNSPIVSLDVNVTGVQTLTLQATNGVANSIDYDHADWAGARLVAAGSSGQTAAAVSEALRPASTISALNIVDLAAPSVPTPWANISVGNTGQLGSASDSAGTFTLAGSGTGVATNADALDYVYESLTGNGTIITHLTTAQASGAQAGILIRENTGAGAKEVGLLQTANGMKFVHRSATGGKTASSSSKAPQDEWEKLVRKGNTFTAYDSTDGKHWKKVGSVTVKMNAKVDVGLAAASGSQATLNTSVFSDVEVSA